MEYFAIFNLSSKVRFYSTRRLCVLREARENRKTHGRFFNSMSDYSSPAGMIEPELLVATCAADGSILSRNSAWLGLLGSHPDIWSNLQSDDAEIARQNLKEASRGSLVTHALFMVHRANRDIPIPVLLHFIPVQDDNPTGSCSVAISGEILSEPSTWTESQTHRHRM